MTVLFDGGLEVHYGFISLQASSGHQDLAAVVAGQVNGMCGAAVAGAVSLRTGLHTGAVMLVVELLPAAPVVGSEWEDVVEVSYSPPATDLHLRSFDEWVDLPPLPAPGPYRVRYSVRGLDAAYDETRSPGDAPLDRYLLQLWLAPPALDSIVRLTSATAAEWHRAARATLPPASAPRRS